MGLTLRHQVKRPLSAAELDANFEYLASNAVSRSELDSITVTNSVYAQTSSYFQGNSDSANYATTAGEALLATTASYVQSVENVIGGSENKLALWNSATTLTSSIITQTGTNIGIEGHLTLTGNLAVAGTTTLSDTATIPTIQTAALQSTTTLTLNSDLQAGTKVFTGTTGENLAANATQFEVGLGDYARTTGQISNLKLTGRLLHTTGSTTIKFLDIVPILEQRGRDFTGKVVGVSYTPTQVTIVRGEHIAFENTIGDNHFNTAEGSTVIGGTEAEGYKLNVSGSAKIGTLLNLAPTSTLPQEPKTGDIIMSGSLSSAKLCYYNGSEWIVL